jgi:predicted esterase
MTNVSISKTARIATHGNAHSAKKAIITLHGYGQLVPYYIRKFKALHENEVFVVAPEGLHRFYLNGTSGRVGASWMTKEAREIDISDNLAYLDQVYRAFILPHQFDEIVVLGFSQGAATAARWIQNTDCKIHAFIQWAGVFPPDLEIDPHHHKFIKKKHFYVVGNEDPYFSNALSNEYNQAEWLKKNAFDAEIINFEGKHDIDLTTLMTLFQKVQ